MSENTSLTIDYQNRKNGVVAVCTLQGIAPNNSLDEALLDQVLVVMREAAQKADAMIFTSAHEKFFSNGLDGKALLSASLAQRANIVEKMVRLCPELLKIEKPWVAEISGYAMAGGAVIASAADYRYMLTQGGRISFSELAVGLPLPMAYLTNLQNFVIPPAIRPLMEGNAYKPPEAKSIGLLDGLADDREKLRSLVLKKVDSILRIDKTAYLLTRNLYRKQLLEKIKETLEEDVRKAREFSTASQFEKVLQVIESKNRDRE